MTRFCRSFLLVLILVPAAILAAQTPPPPAPIPAPIPGAHSLFLANAGMDAFALQAFNEIGLPATEPYDALYASLKSRGANPLINTPAAADLVLEIRSTAPFTASEKEVSWDFQRIAANTSWQFQISLTIYDAKTHFLLWTITEPIRPANLAGTWRKNILAANDDLAAQLGALLAPVPPAHP